MLVVLQSSNSDPAEVSCWTTLLPHCSLFSYILNPPYPRTFSDRLKPNPSSRRGRPGRNISDIKKGVVFATLPPSSFLRAYASLSGSTSAIPHLHLSCTSVLPYYLVLPDCLVLFPLPPPSMLHLPCTSPAHVPPTQVNASQKRGAAPDSVGGR